MTTSNNTEIKRVSFIPEKTTTNLIDRERNVLASVSSISKWLDTEEKRNEVCYRNEKLVSSKYARLLVWSVMHCSVEKRIDFNTLQNALQKSESLTKELHETLENNLIKFTTDLLRAMMEGKVELYREIAESNRLF